MVDLKVRYHGQFTSYFCPYCNVQLAEVHDSGSGQVFTPCQHFTWEEVGNLYYELNAKRLNHNAVLRVWSGETVYILYPKSS